MMFRVPAVGSAAVLALIVHSATASAVTCLSAGWSPNRYSMGYTAAQQWNGIYAQYKTWTPAVHNSNNDFTDSHIYLFRPNSSQACVNQSGQAIPQTWIELGVFTGTLTPPSYDHVSGFTTSGAEYFDWWADARDCMQGRPQEGSSTYGTWNSYELVWNSGKNGNPVYWDVLVNGTRIEQIRNDDLGVSGGPGIFTPEGVALSGGEATDQCYYQTPPCSPSSTYNHISTSAQSVQLQSPTIAWRHLESKPHDHRR